MAFRRSGLVLKWNKPDVFEVKFLSREPRSSSSLFSVTNVPDLSTIFIILKPVFPAAATVAHSVRRSESRFLKMMQLEFNSHLRHKVVGK